MLYFFFFNQISLYEVLYKRYFLGGPQHTNNSEQDRERAGGQERELLVPA